MSKKELQQKTAVTLGTEAVKEKQENLKEKSL
jgi:hypothetical protein